MTYWLSTWLHPLAATGGGGTRLPWPASYKHEPAVSPLPPSPTLPSISFHTTYRVIRLPFARLPGTRRTVTAVCRRWFGRRQRGRRPPARCDINICLTPPSRHFFFWFLSSRRLFPPPSTTATSLCVHRLSFPPHANWRITRNRLAGSVLTGWWISAVWFAAAAATIGWMAWYFLRA